MQLKPGGPFSSAYREIGPHHRQLEVGARNKNGVAMQILEQRALLVRAGVPFEQLPRQCVEMPEKSSSQAQLRSRKIQHTKFIYTKFDQIQLLFVNITLLHPFCLTV